MDASNALGLYNSHPFCFVRSLVSPAEIGRELGVSVPDLLKLNPDRTRHTVVASGTTLVLPRTYDSNRRLHTSKVKIFPNFFLRDSSSWFPPKPPFGPLGPHGRESLFGRFDFEDDPKHQGAIHILGDWASNNVGSVQIPQLRGVRSGKSDSERTGGGRIDCLCRSSLTSMGTAPWR
jgi:hypothetical protein